MAQKIQKICLYCQNPHYRKKFCSNKCKDTFHNIHNPRGFFAKQPDREVVQREITVGDFKLSDMVKIRFAQAEFFEDAGEHGNYD